MSVVRLLVLGLFRLKGRSHGYAIHKELEEWRVDTWTNVKPGSIYHALKQLAKEGKLLAVGAQDSKEGPGRDIYELTPKGEAEFFDLLEKSWASFDLEKLSAAVAFLQELPRKDAIDLSSRLCLHATNNYQHLDQLVANFPNRNQAPHTADLLSLWSGSLQATATWAADLQRRLEDGEYVMAGENKSAKVKKR